MSVPGEKKEETNVYGTPEERAESQRIQDQKLEELGNYFEIPYLSSESYEDNKRLKASSQGVSGRTESSGRISPNQNAGKTFQQTMDEINNMPSSTRKTIEDMRYKLSGNNNVADNSASTTNTGNSNTNTPEVLPRKQYSLTAPVAVSDIEINIPTADEMKASGKKSSEKRMKLYNDSINTPKSRNRMGLFGNYGKDVTIKKTSNEVTGKVNREKFVDGKLVKSRFNNQEFKASKSKGNKNARQNRKNR
jgi:hypothetical protein